MYIRESVADCRKEVVFQFWTWAGANNLHLKNWHASKCYAGRQTFTDSLDDLCSETWSLGLREGHRFTVFENRVLRRLGLFELKRDVLRRSIIWTIQ